MRAVGQLISLAHRHSDCFFLRCCCATSLRRIDTILPAKNFVVLRRDVVVRRIGDGWWSKTPTPEIDFLRMSIMADSVSIRHDNWRNDAQESSSARNVFGLRGFQLDLLTEPGLLRHGRRSCDLNSPRMRPGRHGRPPADHATDGGAEPSAQVIEGRQWRSSNGVASEMWCLSEETIGRPRSAFSR